MVNVSTKQVIKVVSNLNLENSRLLKRELINLLDQGVKGVELDFSNTENVDSSGLGKLLLFNEKFKEINGYFKVTNVTHPEVVQLFRLINLEKFVTIVYKI